MEKNIEIMIEDLINREGGYVDHPFDKGGPTNWGITIKSLSNYIGRIATINDVKNLSRDVAEEIYKRNYYIAPSINTLPLFIQPFIFDSAVNHGPRRAIKFIQSVCNQAGYYPNLSLDGAIGPNTRRAVKWAEREMGKIFLKALIEERRNFYLIICHVQPSQNIFLDGWLKRIEKFDQEVS
ncbi:MAG: XRE family transcriptional regulator [Candidatus Magnetoglobus multicellularis str. Araruama]|uniref:XRE family transcriptional regulator n=1 Tax=Candidatus Magnetoglobus multicellularis str. Araruama TaxID=890399 RepID=A0A1V1NVK2_9BACT|nr:MAG: XRE family transcriptional regulator [Candidatus Magnetoglobus multicellularis str. Araruama]